MAATLMEIKSAMLLPKAAGGEARTADVRRAGPGRPALRAGAAAAGIQAVQGHRRRCSSASSRSTRAASRAIPAMREGEAGRAAAGGSGRSADLGSADGVRPADEGSRRPQAALPRGHLRRHADRPARGRHRGPAEARRKADAPPARSSAARAAAK